MTHKANEGALNEGVDTDASMMFASTTEKSTHDSFETQEDELDNAFELFAFDALLEDRFENHENELDNALELFAFDALLEDHLCP